MERPGVPDWLEGRVVGPPFPSRKNLVVRVMWGGRECVAKVFGRGRLEAANTEWRVLEICRDRGVRAPRPLALREGVIIMSRLEGPSLFELMFSLERPGAGSARRESHLECDIELSAAAPLLEGAAFWLAGFHRVLGPRATRGDSMLKNFLISGGEVYGVDFEEAAPGDPLTDVGQLCAHLLASGRGFSPAHFEAVRHFAEAYWSGSGEDRSGELPPAVAAGLEHYARYRRDRSRLRNWAARILGKGLAGPGAGRSRRPPANL
ncbi:MAG: hypothetical protein ACUVV6_06045 [Thermoplasmatota archaeon]